MTHYCPRMERTESLTLVKLSLVQSTSAWSGWLPIGFVDVKSLFVVDQWMFLISLRCVNCSSILLHRPMTRRMRVSPNDQWNSGPHVSDACLIRADAHLSDKSNIARDYSLSTNVLRREREKCTHDVLIWSIASSWCWSDIDHTCSCRLSDCI